MADGDTFICPKALSAFYKFIKSTNLIPLERTSFAVPRHTKTQPYFTFKEKE